jgi:hypothetical protein
VVARDMREFCLERGWCKLVWVLSPLWGLTGRKGEGWRLAGSCWINPEIVTKGLTRVYNITGTEPIRKSVTLNL